MPFRKRFKKPYEQPPPSPIEISFWETAKPLIPELQREIWIDQYRVDFLIPSKNIVIELYGYQYHNTKQKLTQDAERERYLQRLGYQVIRFTGTEVYKNVQKCVDEVLLLAEIQPAEVSDVAPTRNKSKNVSVKPSVGSILDRNIISLGFILFIQLHDNALFIVP